MSVEMQFPDIAAEINRDRWMLFDIEHGTLKFGGGAEGPFIAIRRRLAENKLLLGMLDA